LAPNTEDGARREAEREDEIPIPAAAAAEDFINERRVFMVGRLMG
jgi:hypothetical protein